MARTCGQSRKPVKRRRREEYAWERGLVKSGIPAGDRMVACAACRVQFRRDELRFGYCRTCWTG